MKGLYTKRKEKETTLQTVLVTHIPVQGVFFYLTEHLWLYVNLKETISFLIETHLRDKQIKDNLNDYHLGVIDQVNYFYVI